MKLLTPCPNCEREIRIKKGGSVDRLQLANRLGVEFTKKCPSCEREVSIHTDDVYAFEDRSPYVITAISLLAPIGFLIYWKYALLSGTIVIASFPFMIPFIVFGALKRNQQVNVDRFNALYNDRKRKTRREEARSE